MADNTTLNSGTGGDTIASDDILGVKFQRVKLTLGADGANDGDVSSSNPLPVGTHAVTQSGTWTVQPGNTANTTAWKVDASSAAVPVTDNSGSLTVDGTVGISGTVTVDSELTTADLDTGAGTDTRAVVGLVIAASGGAVNADGNSGNKSGGTLRVVLATDQPQLTNALKVDGSAVTQPVSDAAGSLTVDAPVGTPVFVRLSDGAAAISALPVTDNAGSLTVDGTVAVSTINSVAPAFGSGVRGATVQRVTVATDDVVPASQSGTWTVQPGNTANTTPWLVTQSPATSGGLSAATGSIGATATSIKGSAGQVFGWYIYNSNASAVYVQFFNTASGSVTLGTTSPVYSIGIPATSGANVEFSNGIAHSTAITIAVTTTRSGSTGPGSTVDYNIFYK